MWQDFLESSDGGITIEIPSSMLNTTKYLQFSAQFVISKRQKCAWLAPGMEGRSKGKPRSSPRTNLSMPTIGESSVISNVDYDFDDDDDDEDMEEFDPEVPLKRPLRTRSCRFPSASSSLASSKKHYSILRRPPLRMTGEGWHFSLQCTSNHHSLNFTLTVIRHNKTVSGMTD